MSELKELIKQRGHIRARLTLFEKYLTPLMHCKETNTLKIHELNLRLNKLRDLSCTFEEVQSKIEMLNEDTGKQVEERETTENSFFYLIAQAQSLLEFFENSNRVEPSCNQTCNSYSNLKLPPLKIPPFDGAPNKWLSFRDTYLSLIHNNENIDDISKFHYLKSYLEGNVSSAINSVTVSSKNYATAWQLLCERYDNKRLLINELFSRYIYS
ncbi:unnamed protein product [Parnassius mnemosyne]|uniref:Uncharacterized protein n=1 Tax=Parnassius mnemosyne TaxID=213953 RepID=A0AAV1K6A7_9NEOP